MRRVQGRGTGLLILLRHGESVCNAAGVFTGLLDIALTANGEQQARRAGNALLNRGLVPDIVYTSQLLRARHTATLLTGVFSRAVRPAIHRCPELAERHYGALTGLSKRQVAAEFGEERYQRWRNSLDAAPPPISDSDLAHLRRGGWPVETLASSPLRTESLRGAMSRTAPFADHVMQQVRRGAVALVVAHGNSLRGLIAHMDGHTPAQLAKLRIQTGSLIYRTSTADRD